MRKLVNRGLRGVWINWIGFAAVFYQERIVESKVTCGREETSAGISKGVFVMIYDQLWIGTENIRFAQIIGA